MIGKATKGTTVIAIIVACVALLAGCTMMVDPNLQAPSKSRQMVEPEAGQWQTWVLTSVDEVRPAPPPDQAATTAEIAQIKTLTTQLDVTATNQIAYWDAGSPSYRWLQLTLD